MDGTVGVSEGSPEGLFVSPPSDVVASTVGAAVGENASMFPSEGAFDGVALSFDGSAEGAIVGVSDDPADGETVVGDTLGDMEDTSVGAKLGNKSLGVSDEVEVSSTVGVSDDGDVLGNSEPKVIVGLEDGADDRVVLGKEEGDSLISSRVLPVPSVGCCDGSSVDAFVGDSVAPSVGLSVGNSLGDSLNNTSLGVSLVGSIGMPLGESLGESLAMSIGAEDGSSVGISDGESVDGNAIKFGEIDGEDVVGSGVSSRSTYST